MNDSQTTNEDLYAALGRVSSGIYILTIEHEGQSTGMLASWVQQAAFEPPMVTVAVKAGRHVGDWIASGTPFALNVVGEKQTEFLKHFGKGFEPGEEAFEGIETHPSDSGLPVLTGAAASLICESTAEQAAGDHRVFLAKVVSGATHGDLSPMTHSRKRGDHY